MYIEIIKSGWIPAISQVSFLRLATHSCISSCHMCRGIMMRRQNMTRKIMTRRWKCMGERGGGREWMFEYSLSPFPGNGASPDVLDKRGAAWLGHIACNEIREENRGRSIAEAVPVKCCWVQPSCKKGRQTVGITILISGFFYSFSMWQRTMSNVSTNASPALFKITW